MTMQQLPLILRFITRLNNILSSVQLALAFVCMFGFVALTVLEVVRRNLFTFPIMWGLELSTFLLIWSVFLTSAVAFREGSHLKVDLIPTRSLASRRFFSWLAAALNLSYFILIVIFGLMLFPQGLGRGTPILGIPVAFGWVSLVVMGIAGILYLSEAILRTLYGDRGLLEQAAGLDEDLPTEAASLLSESK